MAHETELLYVVTLLIFLLVGDLIMSWTASRRRGCSRRPSRSVWWGSASAQTISASWVYLRRMAATFSRLRIE